MRAHAQHRPGGRHQRKITNAVDRKRLKSAAQSLDLPHGMGLIIRTAGAKRHQDRDQTRLRLSAAPVGRPSARRR